MTYGKFIEVLGKENCQKFNFLAKAISREDSRYFMNVALCEGGKLIGTDGRRLHILEAGTVESFGFEDGKVYKFQKGNTKESWWAEVTSITANQFPNWKKVVPDPEKVEKSIKYNSIPFNIKSYHRGPQYAYTKLLREIPKENTINFSFLSDLIPYETWNVSIFGANKGIEFKTEDGSCTAIIMPMQMEDGE